MGYASLLILLSTAAANDMVISNFDIENALCQNSIENDHLCKMSPPGVKQWETMPDNQWKTFSAEVVTRAVWNETSFVSTE